MADFVKIVFTPIPLMSLDERYKTDEFQVLLNFSYCVSFRHDTWDNTFFGISDLEAEQIDPQQRLVLDSVHMALENAGVRKTDLNGSSTGVYIGNILNVPFVQQVLL